MCFCDTRATASKQTYGLWAEHKLPPNAKEELAETAKERFELKKLLWAQGKNGLSTHFLSRN